MSGILKTLCCCDAEAICTECVSPVCNLVGPVDLDIFGMAISWDNMAGNDCTYTNLNFSTTLNFGSGCAWNASAPHPGLDHIPCPTTQGSCLGGTDTVVVRLMSASIACLDIGPFGDRYRLTMSLRVEFDDNCDGGPGLLFFDGQITYFMPLVQCDMPQGQYFFDPAECGCFSCFAPGGQCTISNPGVVLIS